MSVLLLVTTLLIGAEPPTIEQARAQVVALKFADAAKTLKALSQVSGLSQRDAAEFHRLDGLVCGSLNDQAGATAAFTRALSIDPTLTLNGKWAPRVSTPFFEAKAWVRENGSLSLELKPVERTRTEWTIGLALKDPGKLVTMVRLSIEADGSQRTLDVPVSALSEQSVAGEVVRVTAQLLAAQAWSVGSATLELRAPPIVVAAADAPKADAPPATPVEVPRATAPKPPSIVPPLVVLGSGLALGAVGAVLLVQAHQAVEKAKNAPNAVALADIAALGKAQQSGSFAFFLGGAAAAATGAVWLAVAGTAPAHVSVAASTDGAGLTVWGALP